MCSETLSRLGAYSENSIIQGHVLDVLREMPDECVHVCITSPPYFGLRSYNTEPQIWGGDKECLHVWQDATYVRNNDQTAGAKQRTNVGAIGRDEPVQNAFCSLCNAWRGNLGLEPMPDMYVQHLVEIFRELRRALRTDGTCWLVVGDSYASGKGTCFNPGGGDSSLGRTRKEAGAHPLDRGSVTTLRRSGLKPKDQVLIPFRLALALQADGWFVRSTIIWAKGLSFAKHKAECPHCHHKFETQYSGSCMPESTKDRPTQSYEYLFLLTKNKRYFYDQEAVKEESASGPSDIKKMVESKDRIGGKHKVLDDPLSKASEATNIGRKRAVGSPSGRNLRAVWAISPQPFPGSHFAVFPSRLVEAPILAGTSACGCCPECSAPWERVIEKMSGVSKACPKTQAAHEARGGSGVPVGTVGKSGSGRTDGESRTLGWRPTCACSGLTIIPDQPRKPTQRKGQPDIEYDSRLTLWRAKVAEWQQLWNELKPLYEAESKVPAIVLDPFCGSGTTPKVALEHRRHYLGIDLNADYCVMSENRIASVQPQLF